jgi:hypothetical protein
MDMTAERIARTIAAEIGARPAQVSAAAELLGGGATVPSRADAKSLELPFMAHPAPSRSAPAMTAMHREASVGPREP